MTTTTTCRHLRTRIAEPDGRQKLPRTCSDCGELVGMAKASSYDSKFDFTLKGERGFSHTRRYVCICGEEWNSPAQVGKCRRSHS